MVCDSSIVNAVKEEQELSFFFRKERNFSLKTSSAEPRVVVLAKAHLYMSETSDK